jgi:hypothetical protein
MSKSLLFIFALVANFSFSQIPQNCNLVNSATFCVPDSVVVPQAYIHHLNASFSNININQWHYIVMTKNANGMGKLYLDGQLVSSGSYTNIGYNWTRVDLGARFFTQYQWFFNGFMDELRISNIERSSQEISNHFNNQVPFVSDNNTIGLYHFDQSTGSSLNSTAGPNGTISNATWSNSGVFGNCLQFNGVSSYGTIPLDIPENNLTIEVWFKSNTTPLSTWPGNQIVSTYGLNTGGIGLFNTTTTPSYQWSTGSTNNCVTVNPSTMPYLWVTDGNCTDTIWFDSQSAIHYDTITVYDTLLTTVTDTLIIDTQLGLPSPNNLNTILMYPNPASDNLIIDNGNYLLMNGYSISITANSGQQVFFSSINQQQFIIDLSTWNGNGLYHVYILDPSGNEVEHRKIVIQ